MYNAYQWADSGERTQITEVIGDYFSDMGARRKYYTSVASKQIDYSMVQWEQATWDLCTYRGALWWGFGRQILVHTMASGVIGLCGANNNKALLSGCR